MEASFGVQDTEIRGYYRKVAVGCWFTAAGRALPKMLRYEDEEGVRHVVEHIQVLESDQKRSAGNLTQRYECRALLNGAWRVFILLYHPGENIWDMILPGS